MVGVALPNLLDRFVVIQLLNYPVYLPLSQLCLRLMHSFQYSLCSGIVAAQTVRLLGSIFRGSVQL